GPVTRPTPLVLEQQLRELSEGAEHVHAGRLRTGGIRVVDPTLRVPRAAKPGAVQARVDGRAGVDIEFVTDVQGLGRLDLEFARGLLEHSRIGLAHPEGVEG